MSEIKVNIPIRDKIEMRDVKSLVPYARNARTHSEAQIEEIARSIQEFGWTTPVLVDEEGGILAGHGRLLAARKLGMVEVPVISVGDLSEAKRRAYILADNQIALNSGWDKNMLGMELADLNLTGMDMSLTGFNVADLNNYMSAVQAAEESDDEQDAAENAVPDVPEVAVSVTGDVWCLGEHRLICGDATEKKIINALMCGELASLCFTSPPYSDQRNYTTGGVGDWDLLMRGVFGAIPMRPSGQILVNLGLVHRKNEVVPYWNAWLDWMNVIEWRRFGWYVWDQGPGMPGDWNGRLAPAFEFVFHFNRESRHPNKIVPCKAAGIVSHAQGSIGSMRGKDGKSKGWTHEGKVTQDHKIPDSLIRITRQKGGIGAGIDHPAVFPVKFPEQMMLTYSNVGDICYEPFCGSGTSIIAAQKTQRKMRAVEIAPAYVDVAIERFRRLYPDLPITLLSTGEKFAAVASQRGEARATAAATS